MRIRNLAITAGISVVLLALIPAIVGSTGVEVVAGRMSMGLGGDGYWVEPSSVIVKRSSDVSFTLYNDSRRTRVFNLEKITPYDTTIRDIGEYVSLPVQLVEVEGKMEGSFLVNVECRDVSGESWIRITTDDPGELRSALIIRVKVGD